MADTQHRRVFRSASVLLSSLLIGLIAIASVAKWSGTPSATAGPLTPPSGPVAATGPVRLISSGITTLPIVISAPGSYLLASDIDTSALGMSGPSAIISIRASNVSLDLGGHTLRGHQPRTIAIGLDGALDSVAVRNGTIRDVVTAVRGDLGIDVDGQVIVEDVIVRNTFGDAVSFTIGTVRDCDIEGAGLAAIRGGQFCVVENVRIRNAHTRASAPADDAAISLTANGRISRVSIHGSAVRGIEIGAGDTGVSHITDTTISGTLAEALWVGTGAVVSRLAVQNAGSTTIPAVFLGDGSTMTESTVSFARSDGVLVGVGSTLQMSTIAASARHGVVVTSWGHVRDCTIQGSGPTVAIVGAGIYGPANTGGRNRIVGNHLVGNDNALLFENTNTNNIVTNNTASGNSAGGYVFGAGAQAAGPVASNPASSTNPFTNFNN